MARTFAHPLFHGLVFYVQSGGRSRADVLRDRFLIEVSTRSTPFIAYNQSNGGTVTWDIASSDLTHVIVRATGMRGYRHSITAGSETTTPHEQWTLNDLVDRLAPQPRVVILQSAWSAQCVRRQQLLGPELEYDQWHVCLSQKAGTNAWQSPLPPIPTTGTTSRALSSPLSCPSSSELSTAPPSPSLQPPVPPPADLSQAHPSSILSVKATANLQRIGWDAEMVAATAEKDGRATEWPHGKGLARNVAPKLLVPKRPRVSTETPSLPPGGRPEKPPYLRKAIGSYGSTNESIHSTPSIQDRQPHSVPQHYYFHGANPFRFYLTRCERA